MADHVSSSSTGPDRKPRPSTVELVKEAIRETNEPRKGVSVLALKNWIFANYPEVDQTRFGPQLKKALVKALDEGIIERPASSTTTGTLTGRYKLGKALKEADKKAAAKKVSDAKKAAKAAEGGGRSRPTAKKAMDKKLHRRSLSLGASTPKPKKSKSKLHAVARRAQSHSPVKTPMKSPKAAKKTAAKKKTPTKKAKKSPAKAKTAKTTKKAKSPAAKAKKPAAKPKAKKGSTS